MITSLFSMLVVYSITHQHKINFLTVCGSHMSLFMTVMISPFSHTIVYIVFSFSPFMLLGCTFLANFLLAHADSPSELPERWIKSSLRANTAIFACPALKMFAPLLPAAASCLHLVVCASTCAQIPLSVNHQDTASATQAQPKLLLLLNLLHV